MAFEIPSIFRHTNHLRTTGPVLQSHKLHRELNERLIFFSVKVQNGSTLPSPLPYGVFAEIENRENSRESVLEVWVANGYYDNVVKFREVRSDMTRINKYICKGHQIRQVVPAGAFALEGANIWESEVTAIDEVHSLRSTIYIDETNVITRGEYDENIGVHHTVTEELVAASVAEVHAQFPSGSVTAGGTLWDVIEFEELTCGWYLKVVEQMDTAESKTYYGTKNHHWPAVLQAGPHPAPLFGEKDINGDGALQDFTAAILNDIRLKESYSGPCKVQVVTSWTNSIPAAVTPTQMVTDSFHYDGIFHNFGVPDSLHYGVFVSESVGSVHPILQGGQVRTALFPATSLLDWPPLVILPQIPQPYKAGYLIATETIYAPV